MQLRQQGFDAIDRVDDVGAWLALDAQNDRTLLVEPAGEQIVLRSLDDIADVADPHRRAIAIRDDQILVGVRFEQLVISVEGEGLLRTVQRAFRLIDIGLDESTLRTSSRLMPRLASAAMEST